MSPQSSTDPHRLDTMAYETHKLTIAHFDRVLLLNVGGLSLIVTIGSTALLTSQHPLSLSYELKVRLLIGCSLLLASSFLCLLHNYLKLPGLGSMMAFLLNPTDASLSGRMMRYTKVCMWLGLGAKLTMVIGYALLVSVLGSLLIGAR